MRHLGMIGTTFRRAGQTELQRYTLDADPAARSAALVDLHARCEFIESVYLATCNRVEVVFIGRPEVTVAEYRRRLYSYFHPNDSGEQAARAFHAYEGEGAVERLFAVAASVDSMNPGEAQILGQVKEAHRLAQQEGLVAQQLSWVFDEAYSAAKRVRTHTKLGEGTVSMLSLASEWIEARLRQGNGSLVVVGAGSMAEQCAALFARRTNLRLTFVNRTLERAQALADAHGGSALGLATYLENPLPSDVVVTATAAPQPLLDAQFFQRWPGPPPLVVDLAVQRDCDVQAAQAAGATLVDIDRLKILAAQATQARQQALVTARMVLDEELDSFRRKLADRDVAPVVRLLREHYAQAIDTELAELFARVLTQCDPEAQAGVRRWAQGVVNRLAHVPTVGLKKLAFEHGAEAVQAFMDGVQAPPRGRGKKGQGA